MDFAPPSQRRHWPYYTIFIKLVYNRQKPGSNINFAVLLSFFRLLQTSHSRGALQSATDPTYENLAESLSFAVCNRDGAEKSNFRQWLSLRAKVAKSGSGKLHFWILAARLPGACFRPTPSRRARVSCSSPDRRKQNLKAAQSNVSAISSGIPTRSVNPPDKSFGERRLSVPAPTFPARCVMP
jgi:hypothetical protein